MAPNVFRLINAAGSLLFGSSFFLGWKIPGVSEPVDSAAHKPQASLV